ncbi:MAG: polyprenyl synthetase family protein [Deltaproteobacteria bacterium]|nr:polyprenyl synthetase family protein [Deltaproteobacteria bacterium]
MDDGPVDLERHLVDSCLAAPGRVKDACRHILDAPGKRIRPVVCMLAYKAMRGQGRAPADLAVACELLHNATLLHDDVIDEGDVRRGRPAARVVYGNAISVLGGDYLLMKTVEIVSARGPRMMAELVATLRELVDGEVTQLGQRGSAETSTAEYFRIIEGKTASLFRFAAASGALAAGADAGACERIGLYGWHIGVAFQVIDDVLDMTATPEVLGKTLLSDIGEGKMTLPVILAARESPLVKPLLDRLAAGDDAAEIAPRIAALVAGTGAIEAARAVASEHTGKALVAIDGVPGAVLEIARVLKELAGALLGRES